MFFEEVKTTAGYPEEEAMEVSEYFKKHPEKLILKFRYKDDFRRLNKLIKRLEGN